ncbi:MAG: hypothetical protein KatS3mg002_1179 [Candidatus Woesearchaeota archaeon]|nr:MAG: hypothetical protein KatS3mg002_1179 [Candidatus Woesearchaeota archaeon]
MNFAYAIPFSYTYEKINDTILNNQSAYYLLNIYNNNAYEDRYQIYTISAFWDISPSIIQSLPLSNNTVILEITPMDPKLYGPQLVPVTIKSLSDEYFVVENFYVYIKPSNYTPKEYVPSVAMEVRLPDSVDPREPVSLEVYIRNRNPLNLTELFIIVDSELFSKTYVTSLGPLEEKTNQVVFVDMNPLQKPGIYPINIFLIYNNKTISQSSKQLVIKEYGDIKIEQTKIKELFRTKEKIILYNDGNSEVIKQVRIEKNYFQRLFTKSSAKYEKENYNGKSYIVWNVPLKPRETVKIEVITNYTPLVLFIIIVIILVISYYIFRSPVILFKSAKIVSSSEHGVTDVKVKLHIKNRSGKTIRNIKLIDKYPKLMTLEEESMLGSLKPTKMLSGDKTHNLLNWNIEVLDPYEERLIVYKIKSGLNIVGNISLPASKIKFHTASGERSYLSNKVVLTHKSHQSLSEE